MQMVGDPHWEECDAPLQPLPGSRHSCVGVSACVCLHVCVCVCLHVCIHTRVPACVCVHFFCARVSVSAHLCLCVCMCTHMGIRVCRWKQNTYMPDGQDACLSIHEAWRCTCVHPPDILNPEKSSKCQQGQDAAFPCPPYHCLQDCLLSTAQILLDNSRGK